MSDHNNESVWFIPHTPEGALKGKLNEMEESLGFTGKVKYIESLGSKVRQILCDKSRWKENCMTKGGSASSRTSHTKCFATTAPEKVRDKNKLVKSQGQVMTGGRPLPGPHQQ